MHVCHDSFIYLCSHSIHNGDTLAAKSNLSLISTQIKFDKICRIFFEKERLKYGKSFGDANLSSHSVHDGEALAAKRWREFWW